MTHSPVRNELEEEDLISAAEAIVEAWRCIHGGTFPTSTWKAVDWTIPAEQWDAICQALSQFTVPGNTFGGETAALEWVNKGPSRADPSPELTTRL